MFNAAATVAGDAADAADAAVAADAAAVKNILEIKSTRFKQATIVFLGLIIDAYLVLLLLQIKNQIIKKVCFKIHFYCMKLYSKKSSVVKQLIKRLLK